MTPILIFKTISALLQMQADQTYDKVKDSIKALVEVLRPQLPKKKDGTDWTDEDVLAHKDAADLPWHMLIAIANPQADGDDGA